MMEYDKTAFDKATKDFQKLGIQIYVGLAKKYLDIGMHKLD